MFYQYPILVLCLYLPFPSLFFCSDPLSFWLSYLAIFITIIRFLAVPKATFLLSATFLALILSCLVVFGTSELLSLYISYELSLLPIIFMIVKNGVYPDRAVSASIMFIYTAIFSFPFMLYVIYSMVGLGSVSFSLLLPSH